MRRGRWFALIVLCAVGCVNPTQERVREYNADAFRQYSAGNFAAARDSFLASLAYQPEDVGLLYNVGNCYDRLGDGARAQLYYTECLRRAPNLGDCRQSLAGLYLRLGRQQDAVFIVQDWLARQPQLADAYALDGWLWHQTGDLVRAQARLQQALEFDPQNERALVELASVHEDRHRPDLALVLYERVLQQDPNHPDIVRKVNQLIALRQQQPGPG